MPFGRAELIEAFDAQLAEAGEVTITAWLRRLGRLHPDDLARWSSGAGEPLSERLFGDPAVIAREVRLAGELARRRDLTIRRTGRRPGGRLPGLADDWAALAFAPRRTTPQLDLFADSAASTAAHRLATALAGWDRPAAEAALAELEQREPGHPLVAAAPALLAPIGRAENGTRAAWRELEGIAEIARRALDDQADRYLRAGWRALAEAAGDLPAARHDASLAWLRAGEHEAVLQALGPDPTTLESPELLARGIRALEPLGRHREALGWFFFLCWRFPEIGEVLEDLADRVLHLEAALDAWFDGDLPDRLGWQRFPEWLLLARWVPAEPPLADVRPPPCFDAVRAVLQEPQSVEARRRLQATAPLLFEIFMARHRG